MFEVGVQHLTHTGGEFAFKVTRMLDGSPVANAVMGFVAYDYRQNSEIPLSQSLRDALTSASLLVVNILSPRFILIDKALHAQCYLL